MGNFLKRNLALSGKMFVDLEHDSFVIQVLKGTFTCN